MLSLTFNIPFPVPLGKASHQRDSFPTRAPMRAVAVGVPGACEQQLTLTASSLELSVPAPTLRVSP